MPIADKADRIGADGGGDMIGKELEELRITPGLI